MALTKEDKEFINLSIKGVNARISAVHDNLDAKIDVSINLGKITNGRVTQLEEWRGDQRIFCGEIQAGKKVITSLKEKRQKGWNIIISVSVVVIAIMGLIIKLRMPEEYISRDFQRQVIKELVDQGVIIQNNYIRGMQDIIKVADSLNNTYEFYREMEATRGDYEKINPIKP